MSDRRLVGLGFGAIQAGLYLYEADRAEFAAMTLALRRSDVVAMLRSNAGRLAVNVAHAERREVAWIGPVTARDLTDAGDRTRLVQDIAAATDITVAVSRTADYAMGGAASPAAIIAAGLVAKLRQGGPAAVIYASENAHDAAELLRSEVAAKLSHDQAEALHCAAFVDTVIGKMSRVVTDPDEIQGSGLTPFAPGADRAFLVEAFNRIHVAQPEHPQTTIGFPTFAVHADLRPFEHAKLHGHNAAHACLCYLGYQTERTFIADLAGDIVVMKALRHAFLHECGPALCHHHVGTDPMFTPEGFAAFADDLIARMLNPLLNDTIARVGRDPVRKLGWSDRLVGTIRLARAAGVDPLTLGLGVHAALCFPGAPGGEVGEVVSALADPTADPAEVADTAKWLRSLTPVWRDMNIRLQSSRQRPTHDQTPPEPLSCR